MKKKYFRRFTVVMATACMAAVMTLGLAACGGSTGDSSGDTGAVGQLTSPTEEYTNEDGKTQKELNADSTNFLGTWTSNSAHAQYLYGTIEITFNEDGTFDADITEEVFSGTWEKVSDGIEFTSELISGKMYFGKKCRMVIYEDGADPIVLEKKKTKDSDSDIEDEYEEEEDQDNAE